MHQNQILMNVKLKSSSPDAGQDVTLFIIVRNGMNMDIALNSYITVCANKLKSHVNDDEENTE